jgi:hypothetical protein
VNLEWMAGSGRGVLRCELSQAVKWISAVISHAPCRLSSKTFLAGSVQIILCCPAHTVLSQPRRPMLPSCVDTRRQMDVLSNTVSRPPFHTCGSERDQYPTIRLHLEAACPVKPSPVTSLLHCPTSKLAMLYPNGYPAQDHPQPLPALDAARRPEMRRRVRYSSSSTSAYSYS